MAAEVVELTQRLVRARSQNPGDGEQEAAEVLAGYLRRTGWDCELVPVAPGRPNVIARLPGAGGRPLIIIGHLDTVPASPAWTEDPFAGCERDGRIYGLGACDMKGGTAAAVVAATELLRAGTPLAGDVVVCGSCDEEAGMAGVRALVDAGVVTRDAFLLAPEPTECELVVAHKGAYQYELTLHGRAAHASVPEHGVDASRALAPLLDALYRLPGTRSDTSTLLGRSTLVVSQVKAGRKANVVADAATVTIDARTLPTWPRAELEAALDEAVAQATRATRVRGSWRLVSRDRPSVTADPGSPLAAALTEAMAAVARRAVREIGYRAYTDIAMAAALTGARDWAVFGPGSLAQAHAPDEFVSTEELLVATRVMKRAFARLMRPGGRSQTPTPEEVA